MGGASVDCIWRRCTWRAVAWGTFFPHVVILARRAASVSSRRQGSEVQWLAEDHQFGDQKNLVPKFG